MQSRMPTRFDLIANRREYLCGAAERRQKERQKQEHLAEKAACLLEVRDDPAAWDKEVPVPKHRNCPPDTLPTKLTPWPLKRAAVCPPNSKQLPIERFPFRAKAVSGRKQLVLKPQKLIWNATFCFRSKRYVDC